MIRLAEAADAPRISQLWEDMVAYHAQFDAHAFRAADNGAESYARFVAERLRDANARVLVAEMDGAVVGYILGAIADISTGFYRPLRCGLIADIFVCAGQRRRGIGLALVERLALWFRAQGLSSFEWYVSAQNPAALGFWQAVGGQTSMLRMRADLTGDES